MTSIYIRGRFLESDSLLPSNACQSERMPLLDLLGAKILSHAGEFDVDVAAQSGVEEQIPARMMVVVVDIDLIAIPLPVAATVEVVRGNYPVRAIVKDDIARAVVDRARDEDLLHMLVMAMRIVAAGRDAIVLIVPTAVIGAGFLFFPAFVLAVVMTFAVVVFVPT